MDPEELMEKLELLKAEIEWDLSSEYQTVIDETIAYIEEHENG